MPTKENWAIKTLLHVNPIKGLSEKFPLDEFKQSAKQFKLCVFSM